MIILLPRFTFDSKAHKRPITEDNENVTSNKLIDNEWIQVDYKS